VGFEGSHAPMTAKAKPDAKRQVADFCKAARELSADATDEQFQSALRKIAKHKPSER
jgi:hypothetical protein